MHKPLAGGRMIHFAAALLLLAAVEAVAQEGQPQPPQQPGQPQPEPPQPDPRAVERPLVWTFRVPTELGFNTDLDGSPGDVTVTRLGAELGVEIPIATMAQLDLGIDYEYSRYDFNNATGFAPGVSRPWRDIHRENIRARFFQQHDMQLGWLVGGSLGFSGEQGADLGDAFVGTLYGGVRYHMSKTLSVGALLGVATRIEDDPWVLFMPLIDWQIDEQWRLTNAGKPGATLYYTPHQQWTVSLGAWYEQRDFRLDDQGPLANFVGREESVPVAFGVSFRPTSNMTIDFGAGVRLLTDYELDDPSGNKLADIDAEPAPFLSFGVGVKF